MYVLFEEDGQLKAGALVSESDTTAQIDLTTGRRCKVKSANIVLRFSAPAPDALLAQATASAPEIDLQLLWDAIPDGDLSYAAIAQEYFGANANSTQQAATLITLLDNPMYFRKRGKGLFKRAPAAELQAALAGVARKEKEAIELNAAAAELCQGVLPAMFGAPPNATIDRALYAPDKNTAQSKALTLAAETNKKSVLDILRACGAVPSSHDYHFRRFLFNVFPKGTGFPTYTLATLPDLPVASVQAFSIDDAATTEIDDAFSVSNSAADDIILGIHIAVPALGILPGDPLDKIARDRLSTVYMPGNKITMLPDDVVAQYTLAAGRTVPALSLYATFSRQFELKQYETKLEAVPIAANLRLQTLHDSIVDPLATTRAPWQNELVTLHQLAKALFAARGKNEINRLDYNFDIDGSDMNTARILLSTRARGSAIDLIVSELMIFANRTWGKQLADAGVAAMYRVQGGGKTRMAVHPAPHEGLGVPQYLWATSPIRRYSDLVNQRQLLALATAQIPPYSKKDTALLSAVADFDATYSQYAEFQEQMETYWICRYVLQESISELSATVIRENLVRFDTLPIVRRIEGMPFAEPGTPVRLRVNAVDLYTAHLDVARIDG